MSVTSPEPTPTVSGHHRRTAKTVVGAVTSLLGLALLLCGLSLWHLMQGTSGVGPLDVLRGVVGQESSVGAMDLFLGSRLPRLAAAITVGVALGAAGAVFQSVARNALASPDTLAVTAGAYLAVTVVAAFGITLPLWSSGLVAFVGGLVAAVLVLALAGGATSTTRIILAGSSIAMALSSATSTLLILFEEETTSLFAWGSGSLSQLGLERFYQAAPVVITAIGLALLLSRRLDVLGLGEDTAKMLGVPVRATRTYGTVLAVLLTAAAVTLAGPIGFVGLCAPVIARLVPTWNRHIWLIPAAALLGAIIVVAADATLRAVLGPDGAMAIPTGVTTTILGAVVLVVVARQMTSANITSRPRSARLSTGNTGKFVTVLALCLIVLCGTLIGGLLVGYTMLRTGDLMMWWGGTGTPHLTFTMAERAPRVVAAGLAGCALALAGTMVQATCRNPLAEPGILGITGGAGVGAVIVVTQTSAGLTTMATAAVCGALVAFGLVYGLSFRGGLDSDRLVLVGVGVSAAAIATNTFLLLQLNPWDTPGIYTWLSGSTYNRSYDQVLPVAGALVIAVPLVWLVNRELDLVNLDEDTPRIVGVPLETVRLVILAIAAVLTATSVVAVGVVGFVGLVAPHAARALVGARHRLVLPIAMALGAALMVGADAIGRSVVAPAEIPAGLIVAIVGAPYFVYLLAQTRA